jgi:hypothetical protein
LRGITVAAFGFGMIAIVLNGTLQPPSRPTTLQTFLVTLGGVFIGYGFAFPFKWPPHRMVLAMTGMFAAQAWLTGTSFGLFVYVGLTAIMAVYHYFRKARTGRSE